MPPRSGWLPWGRPYIKIWLRIEGGVVVAAGQRSNGCPSAMACASMATHLAVGRETSKLLTLTPVELERILGGLPDGKGEYPELAIAALRAALSAFT